VASCSYLWTHTIAVSAGAWLHSNLAASSGQVINIVSMERSLRQNVDLSMGS
jgi:hypothetical protein